ncbi:ZIP family metal transporter [Paenibacillus hexagrammi]|uniref:Uncharacterized protein n=1 Tax=Paenibacillus hexagrammi TaxID=2908839 RepID=A0ABY3SKB2_9BACL|nr:hypothetical protein [Paenibacillus sp. YPD9-1]UJF33913.1 hypothetical protein L0M14_01245 [Paenibacillus sp. YPD9-1]
MAGRLVPYSSCMSMIDGGIMVTASTYGLIPSALKLSNLSVLFIGILLGTTVLTLMEKLVPHVDLNHSDASMDRSRALLF